MGPSTRLRTGLLGGPILTFPQRGEPFDAAQDRPFDAAQDRLTWGPHPNLPPAGGRDFCAGWGGAEGGNGKDGLAAGGTGRVCLLGGNGKSVPAGGEREECACWGGTGTDGLVWGGPSTRLRTGPSTRLRTGPSTRLRMNGKRAPPGGGALFWCWVAGVAFGGCFGLFRLGGPLRRCLRRLLRPLWLLSGL